MDYKLSGAYAPTLKGFFSNSQVQAQVTGEQFISEIIYRYSSLPPLAP